MRHTAPNVSVTPLVGDVERSRGCGVAKFDLCWSEPRCACPIRIGAPPLATTLRATARPMPEPPPVKNARDPCNQVVEICFFITLVLYVDEIDADSERPLRFACSNSSGQSASMFGVESVEGLVAEMHRRPSGRLQISAHRRHSDRTLEVFQTLG
jgi:hypothetical protein